jgi:acetyl esterase/lipase
LTDAPIAIRGDVFARMFENFTPESAADMRALLARFGGLLNGDLPEIGAFHERVPIREIAGAQVTADVMVPQGEGPYPVLVYLHGGGWICGSPATHRRLCHRFAEAGYLTLSIDYRLAPEHPFPAPYDDCEFAVRWAAREAARWNGDAARLAIGGDSAGGNLAAAVAAALHDDPAAPHISAALFTYHCVADFVAGKDMTAEISMAKLKAGRLVREVADTCLQFHGGMGYVEEYPMSRYFRDARLVSIGGGADEIMLGIIAKYKGFGER